MLIGYSRSPAWVLSVQLLPSGDEEVIWTLGFRHIALVPPLLAKHNLLLFVIHTCYFPFVLLISKTSCIPTNFDH